MIMDEAIRWAKARKAFLELNAEEFLKTSKGNSKEVIQPLPESIMDLWKELSNAEWALYDRLKLDKLI